jgi:hypothetical protein
MSVPSNVNPVSPAVTAPRPAPPPGTGKHTGWRVDLLKLIPPLKWLVRQRWFQFAVILPNLLLFLLFLSAGLFGSPVGNRNIIIVFVWILWWFLLISVMVPLASRVWCLVCPFPFFGEWAQRRALVKVRAVDPKAEKKKGKIGPGVLIGRNRYFGLNRRWPKSLSNIWLQNIGFLALCTFSAHFLTRPVVSVVVLGSLFIIATVLHLIYRQRAFCDYVCPVSGFLSLYAMTSMMEVRSVDEDVCAKCTDKGCLAGNDAGWGCPWLMYPSKMDRNNYCGLCMECIKTCPHDNMTINLRSFCSDTKLKGYDEAWKAFIMLTLALAYSVIYLGPWGFLKDWANVAESRDVLGFLIYTIGLWAGALLVIPSVYALAVWLGRRFAGPHGASAKEVFLGFVYPLVPLGLLVWVAFSLPLLLVNGSYILMVASDPFGWGWDLFGTAHLAWTPVVPHWVPYLQVPLLLVGLAFALKTGWDQAGRLFAGTRQALRAFSPVAVLLTITVLFFLELYIG